MHNAWQLGTPLGPKLAEAPLEAAGGMSIRGSYILDSAHSTRIDNLLNQC